MPEHQESPWRGRLRLSSSARPIPRRESALTEPERDALEPWLPRGAHILTHTRGRVTREGHPLWALTADGVLLATLIDEDPDRLRARVHWVPAEQLRRLDLICEGGLALVRVVTLSRRFVIYGIDEDSATRFVALARATMQARLRLRQQQRAVSACT